jgi:hypothetical protein
MTNLKDKVAETAEHVKNAVTETADKVGHAAAEAFHKGDQAVTDVAHKAKDVAVGTAANIRRIGDKAIDKANGAVHAIGDRGKQARDKKKNGAPERKA